MALSAGTRLGPHEVVSPIGKDGMSEVYSAQDTFLDGAIATRVPLDAFMQERKVRPTWRTSPPATMALLAVLLMAGCVDRESGPAVLTADSVLHLEDHLDAAMIRGSEVPKDIPKVVEWRFHEQRPDWKPAYGYEFSQELVTLVRTGDALRVILEEKHVDSDGDICGYVYTDLPEWLLQEWAYVAVEARVQPGMETVGLAFNFTEPAGRGVWQARGGISPLIADGTVQTYLLRPNPSEGDFDGTWRQLILQFCAFKPSTLDLLSVKVISKETAFAAAPVGVAMESLEGLHNRRALYTHAPATLTYQVRIPDAGQLDVGLRVIRRNAPVTFRVTVTPGGEAETRFEETVTETERWVQRRIDLSDLAGQTVSLALEADANSAGSVALWASPTLSGARTTEAPNVIFYVIDGGGADLMSLYGYNRRTTPNLERIAAEGRSSTGPTVTPRGLGLPRCRFSLHSSTACWAASETAATRPQKKY